MKRKSGFSVLAVMFVTLLMTGCGGGGGSDSPAPPPLPSPPATVSAVPGIGEVTINWTDVTGATAYNVYRSQASPVTKTTGTKITVTDNAVVITGLDNGVKYYFVVTAVNANGESAVSVEVSATPDPPRAPTGVTAVPGDNTATIRWTSVPGASSYNVYRSQTSPVTKTGTKTTGTDNSLVVTGLANGTPYFFVVTVVVNGLESAESSEVTATPTPAIPPAPPAPTNVTGAPGAGSATITWPPVATATSYNAYYSTSPSVTIATGTKVTGATSGGSIPNLIRGIPYYFVVTALNAGGESGVSNQVPVTPNPPNPVFFQSDLAGTWNVRVLRSGASPGWYSQTLTIDGAGIVTVQGSGGSIAPPTVGALTFSAGVVTDSANPTFHGKMSSGKNLIVGTSTHLSTSFGLHIFVKRVPGVTFGSADLANLTFKYHRIYSGSSLIWEIATGSTNALAQVSLTSKEDSTGPLTPPVPNYTTLFVDGTGIVTIFDEVTFTGVMSPDKKIIVGTSTDATGKYSLRIIQVRGQSYTPADLVGSYGSYALHSDSISTWARGTWSTDIDGNVTVSDFVSSDGGGPPGPFTNIIDSQGNVGTLGALSYGKDLMVAVGDYLDGSSLLLKVQ